jgi:hypothetical protein
VSKARLGLAAAAIAASALAAHAAASTAKAPAPALQGSVRIAFAGDGRQVLDDYKQWIFQSDQECYYDKSIKQTAAFSWKTSFPAVRLAKLAKPAGRALAGVQTTVSGDVAGPEVRGDCGSDDVPPGWVETIGCSQPLQFTGPGELALARGKRGTAVLVLRPPSPAIASPTTCSLIPRASELLARVDLAKLAKLARGRSMTLRMGTSSELNCSAHPAPYEGTQVTDDCHDTLTWRGTVTLVKS